MWPAEVRRGELGKDSLSLGYSGGAVNGTRNVAAVPVRQLRASPPYLSSPWHGSREKHTFTF